MYGERERDVYMYIYIYIYIFIYYSFVYIYHRLSSFLVPLRLSAPGWTRRRRQKEVSV